MRLLVLVASLVLAVGCGRNSEFGRMASGFGRIAEHAGSLVEHVAAPIATTVARATPTVVRTAIVALDAADLAANVSNGRVVMEGSPDPATVVSDDEHDGRDPCADCKPDETCYYVNYVCPATAPGAIR
jgi:hypothetical protein